MKSSPLIVALFFAVNTASAAVQTQLKVKGIRENSEHRRLSKDHKTAKPRALKKDHKTAKHRALKEGHKTAKHRSLEKGYKTAKHRGLEKGAKHKPKNHPNHRAGDKTTPKKTKTPKHNHHNDHKANKAKKHEPKTVKKTGSPKKDSRAAVPDTTPDQAVARTTPDQAVVSANRDDGETAAVEISASKGTDNKKEANELNSELDTSSGNKFFTQEITIAAGAILAAGLWLL